MKVLVKGLLGLVFVSGGMAGIHFKIDYSGWIVTLGFICVMTALRE